MVECLNCGKRRQLPETECPRCAYVGWAFVDDLDESFNQAKQAGGSEMLAPQDFPGGRFAILQDPQGATFGVMKMSPS